MKFIFIHSEARIELDSSIAYYNEQVPGLGLDLLSEVEKTLEKIQNNPNLAAKYKDSEVRRYVIKSFPYLIFYTELEENVLVIAIAHARKKPDYWKERQLES